MMVEHPRVVVADTGCWRWTGCKTPDGYGQLKVRGKMFRAHRYFYENANGAVPAGMELDHRCHTDDEDCPGGRTCPHRSCVNPTHLEPVEKAENTRRGQSLWGVNARKTHCHRGHEFTPENTYLWRGTRICRACRAMQDRSRWPKSAKKAIG